MIRDEEFYNRIGHKRIEDRQIDELVGLARGLMADGNLNSKEVEFLEKWLAANIGITGNPVITTLYRRVREILADSLVDAEEYRDLMDTLESLSSVNFELGEVLKSTTLPLCNPAPDLQFEGWRYCFTGTFDYGGRGQCEAEVTNRGGVAGSLTKQTNVLVIGNYATESWKHSSFGNKIIKATEMRDIGVPIAIVSEAHWVRHL